MKLKYRKDGSLKSDLARARGLGSAGHGSETWLNERVSAVAALPLTFWLIWSVIQMPAWDYETFLAWQAVPLNAILMILSIIVMFYHAALGAQVIIEDYIHNEGFKMVKLIGNKLFFSALALACVFSVLKIAFAG